MKFLAALAVACAFLLPAAVASARGFSSRALSDGHVGSGKPELVAQLAYSRAVVAAVVAPAVRWKVAPRHVSCWSHVPWSRTCDRARARLLAHRWLAGLAARRLAALFPEVFAPAVPGWLNDAFLCIHRYEGSWTAATGNGYFGGLQMDLAFQGLYGADFLHRWGTANYWPVWAQVVAAVRAYQSGRGFGPWPNTARACGLL